MKNFRIVVFPYEKTFDIETKENDVLHHSPRDVKNTFAGSFFKQGYLKLKDDPNVKKVLPKNIFDSLSEVNETNFFQGNSRTCVMLENENQEYLAHIFIVEGFVNDNYKNFLFIEGLQSCIQNLMYKYQKDERYIPNLTDYLIEALKEIALKSNKTKIICRNVPVYLQKKLHSYGFYGRCGCRFCFYSETSEQSCNCWNMEKDNSCDVCDQFNNCDYDVEKSWHYVLKGDEKSQLPIVTLDKNKEYTPKRMNEDEYLEYLQYIKKL